MARVAINTGSIANDGTGDTLRAAGGIINSNFSDIYNYFGDGTNLNFSSGNFEVTAVGINTLSSVGIGTTNPRFDLEVGAVGASGTSLWVNGNARVTGILTVGTASIVLDGASNTISVGSGVTINGSTGIIDATSIVVGGTTLTGAGVTRIEAGTGISVDQNTGQVTITATGGGGYWEQNATGINTTSNVGIGTTTASSPLTVKGNTSLETLSVSGVSTFRNTVKIGSATTFTTIDDVGNIGIGTNSAINESAEGNSILSIHGRTSPGNPTLIGSGHLRIYSNQTLLGSIYGQDLTGIGFGTSFVIDSGAPMYIGSASTVFINVNGTSPTQIGSASSTTNEFIITNGGDVGIGTATPEHADGFGSLTLDGKAYQNGPLTQYGGGNILLRSRGNNAFNIYSYSSVNGIATATNIDIYHDLYFLGSTGTNLLVVTESGKVGIGTTNPTSTLTVTGTTFTNQLSVSGVSTLGTVQVSSGIVTATSGIVIYYGDASNAADGRWSLGANGTSDYTFTGIGFTQTTNDPVLYLARGRVYEFVNDSGGGHPFEIRVSNGGAAYGDGVTNNAAATGVIRFEVPFNAPNTLYYQCTNHSGMGNTISVYPNTI